MHGALHPLVQPSLQSPGILIQPFRLRNTTMVKPQLTGPSFDPACMKVFIQVYYLIPWEYLEFNNFINLPA